MCSLTLHWVFINVHLHVGSIIHSAKRGPSRFQLGIYRRHLCQESFRQRMLLHHSSLKQPLTPLGGTCFFFVSRSPFYSSYQVQVLWFLWSFVVTHHAPMTRLTGIEQSSEHDRRGNVVVRMVGMAPMITQVRGGPAWTRVGLRNGLGMGRWGQPLPIAILAFFNRSWM